MKKPWRVEPNQGKHQAYMSRDDRGRPIVRQSLVFEGRVLWFDMTPEESVSLVWDLKAAQADIHAETWASGESVDYPDARF